jgi:hypothetical protein
MSEALQCGVDNALPQPIRGTDGASVLGPRNTPVETSASSGRNWQS